MSGFDWPRHLRTALDADQVPKAHRIYYQRSPEVPGIDSAIDSYLGRDAAWKFVKVTPEEIGYFDTKSFGGDRQVVPLGVKL